MDSAKAREEGRRGKEEQRGWKQGGSSAQTDSVIVHTVLPSVFIIFAHTFRSRSVAKFTAAIPNVTALK